MDVHLEPQSQLLSRIQYVITTESQFSLLVGKPGVGKSFVTSMLVESLVTTLVIELPCPEKFNFEQFERELICQLATDELSDMRCSMATAIQSAIDYYRQPLLILIDNADHLSQEFVGALWNSFNEILTRLRPPRDKLNILLVGNDEWAKAVVEQLQGVNRGGVTTFELSYLSNDQAADFLSSIHPDWSAQKIEGYVSSLAKKPLTPQRLIFAETPTVISSAVSWKMPLILLSILLLSVVLALFFADIGVTNGPETREPVPSMVSIAPAKQQRLTSDSFKPDSSGPDSLVPDNSVPDALVRVESIARQQQSLPATAAPTPVIPENNPKSQSGQSAPLISEMELNDAGNDASKQTQHPGSMSNVMTERQKLLMIPESHFSLMLGGYSQAQVIGQILNKIDDKTDLYAYKTIRNDKDWFVLLYGDFADKASAQRVLEQPPAKLAFSSPWIKSFRVIHAEITAVAATMDNNN